MNERERLVELIAIARNDYYDYSDEIHENGMCVEESSEEYIADYLLANGVIVPHKASVKRVLIQAEEADVEEVVHGEWIISSDGYYPFCSNCRYEPPFVGGRDMRTPRCPKCGAKMDGGC